MKHILTTVLALLLSLPTWAIGVGSINDGTITGGHLYFYRDAKLTNLTRNYTGGEIVYIKATPDGIHTGIGVQFTVEKSLPSSAAQSRTLSDSGINMAEPVNVTAVEGRPGVYSFVMPEIYNVTVNATFADKPTTSAKYLDANGEEKTANNVYIIEGTEQKLGAIDKTTWWVVNSNVEYTQILELLGDVHLILADGCKMNMTVNNRFRYCISGLSDFVIYGQPLGTGCLAINVTAEYVPIGIYANNLTVNGGIINVTAHNTESLPNQPSWVNSTGILANNSVTINGGQITANGASGIYAGDGVITLGCNKYNDFVNASNYIGTVKIAEGQTLFEGENTYSGTLTDEQIKAIEKKKLYPGHFWHADANHDGTEAKPYVISTNSGLDMLAYFVKEGFEFEGKYFQLGADIAYTYTTQWNDATSTENNYTPIGGYLYVDGKRLDRWFKGHFDGKNHTVSGIRVYSGGEHYYIDSSKGLFGYISQGSVKNINLTDARVTGYRYVGGIAGLTNGAIIENSHVSNTVCIHAVVDNCIAHGGIVGHNKGLVKSCTSSAILTIADGVSGCSSFGGIAGQNDSGCLQNSVAYKASIAATFDNNLPYSGAIVGCNLMVSDKNGVVNKPSNCYYIDCQVGTATTNIGSGMNNIFKGSDYNSEYDIVVGDITDNNGAVSAFTLTLNAGISTTTAAALNYLDTNYYAAGSTIVLTSNIPEGYVFSSYSVKDAAGNTIAVSENAGAYSFTMPAADVVINISTKKLLTNSDISIADITTQTYTGSEIKPAVVVKDGETDITSQCTITYTNNTNAGTATVTITAKSESNYSGTVTKTFTIAPKAVTVTADNKTKEYGAADPELTATVVGLIGEDKIAYTLSRAEGEDAGEYTITASGEATQGNYSVTFVAGKLTITKPEPNTEVVNPEETVTVGGETFYEPKEETKEALKEHFDTDFALSAEAANSMTVNSKGEMEFKQGQNVDVAIPNKQQGDVVTFKFIGKMFGDSSKLRRKGGASTRSAGDMELISGAEYEVLETGSIVITVAAQEAPVTFKGISTTANNATGIEAVNKEQQAADSWYDLNGRKVEKPTQKGIYIHNGQKVVIK